MLPESDDFSSLVLDSLRLQETIAAAQQAPAHERAWFLQDTRQTLFIAGLHWMIQHDEACELLEPLPLAFLPGMPTWFRGLAHWHGQALPVLDLAQFWQIGAHAAAPLTSANSANSAASISAHKPMLLVLGHSHDAAGVCIDRLPGHLRLSDAELDPDLNTDIPPLMRSHLRARYRQGKRAWLDIDVRQLLRDIEQALQAPSTEPAQKDSAVL